VLTLKADEPVAGNGFLVAVQERSGVRVQDCYQCGKCTAGCPVASYMDLMPRQIMRAVQLGQHELVLRSSTIWLCASCQTCSARCPMELNIAGVMESLRHLALAEGVPPAEKDIVLAHNIFLESIKRLGRVYEVGLVAALNLGTRHPFANVRDVGLPMFRKGKLEILPQRAGGAEIKRIFAKTRKA
jgi:heterodisulfide reductase subunit C2